MSENREAWLKKRLEDRKKERMWLMVLTWVMIAVGIAIFALGIIADPSDWQRSFNVGVLFVLIGLTAALLARSHKLAELELQGPPAPSAPPLDQPDDHNR